MGLERRKETHEHLKELTSPRVLEVPLQLSDTKTAGRAKGGIMSRVVAPQLLLNHMEALTALLAFYLCHASEIRRPSPGREGGLG